jgi:Family of unknown function (DUF6064)
MKLIVDNGEEDMSNSIPFTIEQFFQVFEKYNQAIYPIQFVLILVAIVIIFWQQVASHPETKIFQGYLGCSGSGQGSYII